MSRIITDEPSTGKNIILFAKNISTDWVTLCEAPDFSVPLGGNDPQYEDPQDSERELSPGEIFIGAPILVTNKDIALSCWVEFRVVKETDTENPTEDDISVVSVTPKVSVSYSESIQIPLQGLVLIKSDVNLTYGGRLQVRAERVETLDVYGAASESAYADHAPDTEGV